MNYKDYNKYQKAFCYDLRDFFFNLDKDNNKAFLFDVYNFLDKELNKDTSTESTQRDAVFCDNILF